VSAQKVGEAREPTLEHVTPIVGQRPVSSGARDCRVQQEPLAHRPAATHRRRLLGNHFGISLHNEGTDPERLQYPVQACPSQGPPCRNVGVEHSPVLAVEVQAATGNTAIVTRGLQLRHSNPAVGPSTACAYSAGAGGERGDHRGTLALPLAGQLDPRLFHWTRPWELAETNVSAAAGEVRVAHVPRPSVQTQCTIDRVILAIDTLMADHG
jgi:hypothetical protein